MKATKKQLAILIALAMLVSLIPVTTFADEIDGLDENGGATHGTQSNQIDDDMLRNDEPDDENIGDSAEDAAISPTYMDFAAFSGPISTIPNSIYGVETGYEHSITIPPWGSLRPGQIWTGKEIFYPQEEISPGVFVSDGTVLIKIYVWGKPFADGYSLIEPDILGNAHIMLEAEIGDFHFDALNWSDSTGYVGLPGSVDFVYNPGTPPTLQWYIDEIAITDSDGPLVIWYLIYLDEDPDWLINYWYSTAGSFIEVKFQPNMNNPFYWTKYEETTAEFTAIVNWNNGGGINSATITDNILGITISFGKNPSNQPPNQDALTTYTFSAYPQWWTYGATVRGDPVTYYWHLNWTKDSVNKIYYITVRGLTTDAGGQPVDIQYVLDLGRAGGNTAFAAGRYLVSEKYFRRTLDDDGIPFTWDANGNLVYREHLIAQIKLVDADLPMDAALSLVKNNVPEFPGIEWYFDGAIWEFNARVRVYDSVSNDFLYATFEPVTANIYRFTGFDVASRASVITLRQLGIGSEWSNIVKIIDLPMYPTFADYANSTNPLQYQVVEFFVFSTLGLIHANYYIDSVTPDFETAIMLPSQPGEYCTFGTELFYIVGTSETAPRKVTLRNTYDHGIGFLEVHKLLDGFPANFGVSEETEFYVRIFDVSAGNYLLFAPHIISLLDKPYLPIWSDEFIDTWWCVGNHEKGLTFAGYDPTMIPLLELPISVYKSIRISNLWTGMQYEVVEVKRIDGVDETMTEAAWLDFWNTWVDDSTHTIATPPYNSNRLPAFIPGSTWMSNGLGTWLEDNYMSLWEPVRRITDDTVWHEYDVEDWYWGVIYPENDPSIGMFNPTAPLGFNQTANITITNRYKYHCGTLELNKVLCENAIAWGMTDDTMFHAQVLTDEMPARALVFVPHPEGQTQVLRMIGFMGINPVTGLADVAYGYQVLCPVGSITPPTSAITKVAFSVNRPVTLIEVPSYPFVEAYSGFVPMDYIIEFDIIEVFPSGEPVGFDDSTFLITGDQGFVTTTVNEEISFPHLSTRTAEITNNFFNPHGNLVIYKELVGHYASWGVDENTLFWAGVSRGGARLNFYAPEPNVFVYVDYPSRLAFVDPSIDPIANEVSFSVANPAVVIGLTTSGTVDPTIIPYEVVELRVNTARFAAEVGEIERIDDNLFVTITNTFVQRPGGNGGGGGGGTPPPDEKEPEQRTVNDFFVDEHIWYLRGYEDTTIRPNNSITRAEVAMAFYRLLRPEMKNISPNSPFSDVADDAWYGRGVSILAYYGIVTGYTDDLFKPNSPITRRELAAVVSRFDQLLETDENPYMDISQTDWARKYILSATKRGWFVGYGGLFRPEAYLTRGEFATAVNRVLNRHILLKDIPDDIFNFPDLFPSHWAYTALIEAAHTHEYIRREDGKNEIWTKIISTGLDAAYNE